MSSLEPITEEDLRIFREKDLHVMLNNICAAYRAYDDKETSSYLNQASRHLQDKGDYLPAISFAIADLRLSIAIGDIPGAALSLSVVSGLLNQLEYTSAAVLTILASLRLLVDTTSDISSIQTVCGNRIPPLSVNYRQFNLHTIMTKETMLDYSTLSFLDPITHRLQSKGDSCAQAFRRIHPEICYALDNCGLITINEIADATFVLKSPILRLKSVFNFYKAYQRAAGAILKGAPSAPQASAFKEKFNRFSFRYAEAILETCNYFEASYVITKLAHKYLLQSLERNDLRRQLRQLDGAYDVQKLIEHFQVVCLRLILSAKFSWHTRYRFAMSDSGYDKTHSGYTEPVHAATEHVSETGTGEIRNVKYAITALLDYSSSLNEGQQDDVREYLLYTLRSCAATSQFSLARQLLAECMKLNTPKASMKSLVAGLSADEEAHAGVASMKDLVLARTGHGVLSSMPRDVITEVIDQVIELLDASLVANILDEDIYNLAVAIYRHFGPDVDIRDRLNPLYASAAAALTLTSPSCKYLDLVLLSVAYIMTSVVQNCKLPVIFPSSEDDVNDIEDMPDNVVAPGFRPLSQQIDHIAEIDTGAAQGFAEDDASAFFTNLFATEVLEFVDTVVGRAMIIVKKTLSGVHLSAPVHVTDASSSISSSAAPDDSQDIFPQSSMEDMLASFTLTSKLFRAVDKTIAGFVSFALNYTPELATIRFFNSIASSVALVGDLLIELFDSRGCLSDRLKGLRGTHTRALSPSALLLLGKLSGCIEQIMSLYDNMCIAIFDTGVQLVQEVYVLVFKTNTARPGELEECSSYIKSSVKLLERYIENLITEDHIEDLLKRQCKTQFKISEKWSIDSWLYNRKLIDKVRDPRLQPIQAPLRDHTTTPARSVNTTDRRRASTGVLPAKAMNTRMDSMINPSSTTPKHSRCLQPSDSDNDDDIGGTQQTASSHLLTTRTFLCEHEHAQQGAECVSDSKSSGILAEREVQPAQKQAHYRFDSASQTALSQRSTKDWQSTSNAHRSVKVMEHGPSADGSFLGPSILYPEDGYESHLVRNYCDVHGITLDTLVVADGTTASGSALSVCSIVHMLYCDRVLEYLFSLPDYDRMWSKVNSFLLDGLVCSSSEKWLGILSRLHRVVRDSLVLGTKESCTPLHIDLSWSNCGLFTDTLLPRLAMLWADEVERNSAIESTCRTHGGAFSLRFDLCYCCISPASIFDIVFCLCYLYSLPHSNVKDMNAVLDIDLNFTFLLRGLGSTSALPANSMDALRSTCSTDPMAAERGRPYRFLVQSDARILISERMCVVPMLPRVHFVLLDLSHSCFREIQSGPVVPFQAVFIDRLVLDDTEYPGVFLRQVVDQSMEVREISLQGLAVATLESLISVPFESIAGLRSLDLRGAPIDGASSVADFFEMFEGIEVLLSVA